MIYWLLVKMNFTYGSIQSPMNDETSTLFIWPAKLQTCLNIRAFRRQFVAHFVRFLQSNRLHPVAKMNWRERR